MPTPLPVPASSPLKAMRKSPLHVLTCRSYSGHYWAFEETGSPDRYVDLTQNGDDLLNGGFASVSGIIGNAAGGAPPTGPRGFFLRNLNGFNATPEARSDSVTAFGWSKFSLPLRHEVVALGLHNSVGGIPFNIILRGASGGEFILITDTSTPVPTAIPGDWFFWSIIYESITPSYTVQINDDSPITVSSSYSAPVYGVNFIVAPSDYTGDTADGQFADESGVVFRKLTADERNFAYNGGAGRTWPEISTLFGA
jgi:hypothetical protein